MQSKEYIAKTSPLYMKYKHINPNTKQTRSRAGHAIYKERKMTICDTKHTIFKTQYIITNIQFITKYAIHIHHRKLTL